MPTAWKFLLVGLVGSLLFVGGCKVRQPGKVETEMTKEVKHKITVGGKEDVNPIQATDANIADGREHFGHHCAICHGLDGQGTGVPFAEKMSPPVPSLTSADVQDYKDGQLRWIIQNGINPSGMPAWNGILSDDETWKVVVFLRHLPPKGSLGIPDVYKEEQEEHEKMHQKDKHHH